MDKDKLYAMLTAASPSGGEIAWLKDLAEGLKGQVDDIATDAGGDVCAIVNPQARYKVMLAGHADEICLRVCDATDDGYLKAVRTGGVQAPMYPGHKVRIIAGDRVVYGAVVADRELYSEKTKVSDLAIDIGARDRAEALQAVPHGSFVLFDSDVRPLLNDRITARAMDDRIGVYIVTQAVIKARQLGIQVQGLAVADVGEETGSKGAYFAASRLRPDMAIAVDVTYASDFPSSEKGSSGRVAVGGGPVLDNGSWVSPVINQRLARTAADHGLNIQYELSSGPTWTDADRLMFTGSGVPFGLVSIPLRNMHSPAEVGSLDDIQACVDLLAWFLADIGTGLDCDPFRM